MLSSSSSGKAGGADTATTNPSSSGRRHESGHEPEDAGPAASIQGHNFAAAMAAAARNSTLPTSALSSRKHVRESSSRSGTGENSLSGLLASASPAQSSSGQDGLLQIPGQPSTLRHPVESSVWDWEAPSLEAAGASYFYEPQGELLNDRRSQNVAAAEFSIPDSVPGSGVSWSASNPLEQILGNGGAFAVPKAREETTPTAGLKRKATLEHNFNPLDTRPDPKRTMMDLTNSGDGNASPQGSGPSIQRTTSQQGQSNRQRAPDRGAQDSTRNQADNQQRGLSDPSIAMVLPARKVFPIQIGDKLFRLSGASISSDAPSYFSQFFEEQLRQNDTADSLRTLYIDRDPSTFEDISLHLQGYHVEPRDGPHFVKLFADAQFYSLPRLSAQLFASTIYIRIGSSEFQIPRDLFSSPGDSPNYFSLGFSSFFTTPTEIFPGLHQRTLLRPPSLLPPSVPNRSAETFADLLRVLKGYPLHIKDAEHRAELLRDARYFHLKGLEQRLIPCSISYNLARRKTEILIRLEDIRQSGISFAPDSSAPPVPPPHSSTGKSPASSSISNSTSSPPSGPGWVYYQRPYVDSESYALIIEIAGDENMQLSLAPGHSGPGVRFGRATFVRQTLARITSLFGVVANKMNLPITQPLGLMMMERNASGGAGGVGGLPVSPGNTGVSGDRVKVRLGSDAAIVVDGRKWVIGDEDVDEDEEEEDDDEEDNDDEEVMEIDPATIARKRGRSTRSRNEDEHEAEEWIVKKSHWRLRVQPVSGNGGHLAGRSGMEVILGAVKIEAFRSERGRNEGRGFLL